MFPLLLPSIIQLDKCEVMERLWEMTGTELRSFHDTGGELPKVRTVQYSTVQYSTY